MTTEEILMQQDVDIQELKTRLNNLENLVNQVQQKKPPYWV